MSYAGFAVQQAIYAALTAALSVNVYDHVSDDTAFPYVTIDGLTARADDTKTHDGQSYTVTLSVWSEKDGQKECAGIMKEIHAALHDRQLNVNEYASSAVRFEFASSIGRDQSGLYSGAMRFRVETQD